MVGKMKTFSIGEVVGIGGPEEDCVAEAVERIVKPQLNGYKLVSFNKQYILLPPTIPHYVQLDIDDDLLDPRRPNNPTQTAFHYMLAQSRKLQCIWILPVTYSYDIGGEWPHNLKQRLLRLYMSLSVAIEAKEGKALVYNFNTTKRQLYVFKEKV